MLGFPLFPPFYHRDRTKGKKNNQGGNAKHDEIENSKEEKKTKRKKTQTYKMQHSNEGTDRVLQVAFRFVPNSDFLFFFFFKFYYFYFFSTQRELDQTLTMSRVLSPVEM